LAGVPVYKGDFGEAEATRLLWRAGFGPKPGEAAKLARHFKLKGAVHSLTRPRGAEVLKGPEPVDDDGLPIAPFDAWGHDLLWWLDRMVRTNHPLVERMALIWHDWFATAERMPASCSAAPAGCIFGLSFFEPMMIPTRGASTSISSKAASTSGIGSRVVGTTISVSVSVLGWSGCVSTCLLSPFEN
jgi:hypothetical protein